MLASIAHSALLGHGHHGHCHNHHFHMPHFIDFIGHEIHEFFNFDGQIGSPEHFKHEADKQVSKWANRDRMVFATEEMEEFTYLASVFDKWRDFSNYGFLATLYDMEGLYNLQHCTKRRNLNKLEVKLGISEIIFSDDKMGGAQRIGAAMIDKLNVFAECMSDISEDFDQLTLLGNQFKDSKDNFDYDFFAGAWSEMKGFLSAKQYQNAGDALAKYVIGTGLGGALPHEIVEPQFIPKNHIASEFMSGLLYGVSGQIDYSAMPSCITGAEQFVNDVLESYFEMEMKTFGGLDAGTKLGLDSIARIPELIAECPMSSPAYEKLGSWAKQTTTNYDNGVTEYNILAQNGEIKIDFFNIRKHYETDKFFDLG